MRHNYFDFEDYYYEPLPTPKGKKWEYIRRFSNLEDYITVNEHTLKEYKLNYDNIFDFKSIEQLISFSILNLNLHNKNNKYLRPQRNYRNHNYGKEFNFYTDFTFDDTPKFIINKWAKNSFD